MKRMTACMKTIPWICFALTALFLFGCAHHLPLPREEHQWAYQPAAVEDMDITRWAPVFVVYGYGKTYNRIGQPRALPRNDGGHRIVIDPESPTLYYMKRTFRTERAVYTNLIYRVHFPGIPFSLVPFNLTTGKNAGLMVVVTLDDQHRPILITTVHTCGCYKAIVATRYLPQSARPDNWRSGKFKVYGEHLPTLLNFDALENPRLLVHLRPEVHRVMDLQVLNAGSISGNPRFQEIPADMVPMAELNRLAVNGEVTSLYHTDGAMSGYVKGAVKPLETIFLSLISLDLFVGTDKAYADPDVTGNHFYTSLKPWRRKESNMWDFAGFLHYWGWRL